MEIIQNRENLLNINRLMKTTHKSLTLLIVMAFFNAIIMSSCITKVKQDLSLAKVYSNHMVIQRNMPINIWGQASSYQNINLYFNNETYSTKADENGNWKTSLPKLPAGGPYTLSVSDKDTSIIVNDILIGDVWICSGQSNMEWPLRLSDKGSREIDTMDFPNIRVFNIGKEIEFEPINELRGDVHWKLADGDIADFSAVAYYFGKELHQSLNIPIGLISNAWGGMEAEAWMNKNGALPFTEFTDELNYMDTVSVTIAELNIQNDSLRKIWLKEVVYSGIGMTEKWYEPGELEKGREMYLPGFIERAFDDLKAFDGELWFKRQIQLPTSFLDQDLLLSTSMVDDYDLVWVNGVKVGGGDNKRNENKYYVVDKSILKPGANEITIRIFDVGGKGGLKGDSTSMYLALLNNKESRFSIAGTWDLKLGEVAKQSKGIGINPNMYATSMYNAMVHPIINFPIKGVVWYQGEANVRRAHRYATLFPAMINNWRAFYNQGDFPFLFVQIANYQEYQDEPFKSIWAELRESQTKALSLPNTGMAVTIDIGNPKNIHPRNKTDVGKRLALQAYKVAYNLDTLASSPSYLSHQVVGNGIQLTFSNVSEGLHTTDGTNPAEFAIAGSDSVFHMAQAKITAPNVITLTSKKVVNPMFVRYAWADSPVVNTCNSVGLPMVPFRTDDFEGLTFEQR